MEVLTRCECSLCSASKPLRQWKKPRSFLPLKLGIEQMNKVPGKIKISYLSVKIFERPLNIPKRHSIENIGILYNYGPSIRATNAQRLPSPIWEHSHLWQDFKINSPYLAQYFSLTLPDTTGCKMLQTNEDADAFYEKDKNKRTKNCIGWMMINCVYLQHKLPLKYMK